MEVIPVSQERLAIRERNRQRRNSEMLRKYIVNKDDVTFISNENDSKSVPGAEPFHAELEKRPDDVMLPVFRLTPNAFGYHKLIIDANDLKYFINLGFKTSVAALKKDAAKKDVTKKAK